MKIAVSASASATVANQPSFDLGGFPVRVIAVIAGKNENWESLKDTVSISVGELTETETVVDICNIIEEPDVDELPTKPEENTAGKLIIAAIDFLRDNGIDWKWPLSVRVEKGISIKGTGLGSSGATPAAALRAFEEIMKQLGVSYVFGNHTKAQLLVNADNGVPDNSVAAYFGGLVEISHHNGEVSIEKIQPHEDFGQFVIVTPRGFGIKTSDARKALEGVQVFENHTEQVRAMQEAIKAGKTKEYGRAMEKAHAWFVGPRSRLYPKNGEVYDAVYQAAKEAGASGVTISGAGPTMIALAEDKYAAWRVGETMHAAFKQSGFDSVARLVAIDGEGAKLQS